MKIAGGEMLLNQGMGRGAMSGWAPAAVEGPARR